jgi:hypothetical protein
MQKILKILITELERHYIYPATPKKPARNGGVKNEARSNGKGSRKGRNKN